VSQYLTTLSNSWQTNMSDEEITREERILRVMKRVLTGIAKDTYTR
jgi:hypothetical protein